MATTHERQESPEYSIFREYYDRLYHAVQGHLSLAIRLYSTGIISSAVMGHMSVVGLSTREKNSALLSAVEKQIQAVPQAFHVLLSALNEDPSMQSLVESMQRRLLNSGPGTHEGDGSDDYGELQKALRPYTVKAKPTGIVLGSGTNGRVIELLSAGEIVVGKVFKTSLSIHHQVMNRLYGELTLMTQVHHPNIVQCKGVCFLENETMPVLLMERLRYNLHTYLLKPANLNIALVRKLSILCDVASGLLYLHSHKPAIIHRDLNGNNVLLDSKLRAKISDFGNARIMDLDPEATLEIFSSLFPDYMPPEAQGDSAQYGPSLDVFSFGHLSLFTINQTPVHSLLPPNYIDADGLIHARSEVKRRKEYLERAEQFLGEKHSLVWLVKQCLHDNPGQRPPTAELVTRLQDILVRQSYESELRYGHIDTYIAKVLLFGIAGSGKTSVTAIMLGDPPPPVRESTSLMARPVQVITVLLDELTKWEKKTSEEVRRRIAEIIRSRELQKTDLESAQSESTASTDHPIPNQQIQNQNQQIQNQQIQTDKKQLTRESPQQVKEQTLPPTLVQPFQPEFYSLLDEAKKVDDFLSLVDDCDPFSEPILKQRWLYIIDSGGQPEFHNMLSIFVQNTAACIFVFRMHEGLDDCSPVAYYKGGSSLGPLQHSRMTNRQIFEQFMRTMRSFSSIKNRVPPRVLLLATHRDLVGKSELPKLLEERQKQLKAIILPQFQDQLIYCDEQLEEFIFTMNAKEPESKDKDTANTIRKKITEVCSGEKEKVKIPLRWHNLDHQSRWISDGLKRKVLSREEYGEIAKSLNINHKSCEGALNFFSGLNTIFYFPKVLPHLVFLDTQILLDKLNELVAKSYRMSHKPTQSSSDQATVPQKYHFQFRDLARVTVELLNEFKEHYYPPLFTSKDLAILFEKLLIFGKLEEGAWFVPSILPSLEEEEVEQYCERKERALVIYFPDGGPKNGIFCSTVSFLLSNDNTSPGPWEVLKVSGNPVCLKRNVIIFIVGDFCGKVTLVEKWTHFELYVNTDEDSEGDLWKLVYNAVFSGLTKATETHHYSDTDNIPQAAIICREQDKDHPSTPHPATIKRQKGKWKWTCTKSQQWGGKISGNIPWLNLLPLVDPPQITQHPIPQLDMVAGSTVKFTFTTTGGRDLTYKWQRNGAALNPLPEGMSGETTDTLQIDNVKRKHEGTCTCIVSNNTAGPTPSNPAQLTVRESGMQPQLQQNPPQLQLAGASQQHTSSKLCQQVREPIGRQQLGRQSQGETGMFHTGTPRSPPSKKRKITTAMKPTLAQLKIMKTTTGEKIKIIESVAPQWKELGDLLDFDPEGRTLELIEANHQQKGHVACCREMFAYWVKGKGREATWEVLIELLDDIDQSELAKQVKTALQF